MCRNTISLRDYQVDCLRTIKELTAPRKAIVIPTGGGKTVIFAAYALRHNLRSFVLAHRIELIDQTREAFLALAPSCDVGIVMGKRNQTDAHITIASLQALARRNRLRQRPTDYDLIICDEAHDATADSYRRIFFPYGLIDLYACGIANGKDLQTDFDPNRTLFGVTATPERTDEKSLDTLFEDVVYRLSIADLIPGYLSDFRLDTHTLTRLMGKGI